MPRLRLLSTYVSGNQSSMSPVECCKACSGKRGGRRLERRLVSTPRPQGQAAGSRGLQRIGHVQVVGPSLGPVFPRMDAGVRTDELLLPGSAWPLVVMLLERLGVVLPLVAKTARGSHR